jgi:hypothetical protein
MDTINPNHSEIDKTVQPIFYISTLNQREIQVAIIACLLVGFIIEAA